MFKTIMFPGFLVIQSDKCMILSDIFSESLKTDKLLPFDYHSKIFSTEGKSCSLGTYYSNNTNECFFNIFQSRKKSNEMEIMLA